MNKLLIDERPLVLLPQLAKAVGLNEALFLQQLHYWLHSKISHEREGKLFIYNSLRDWQSQFPFFSASTLWRTIKNLEQRGLILCRNYNAKRFDRTGWYTINYDEIAALELETSDGTPSSQNEPVNSSNRNAVSQTDDLTSRQSGITIPDKENNKDLFFSSDFFSIAIDEAMRLIDEFGLSPNALKRHLAEMESWIANNPTKRPKTYAKFVSKWLSRHAGDHSAESSKGAAPDNRGRELPTLTKQKPYWA